MHLRIDVGSRLNFCTGLTFPCSTVTGFLPKALFTLAFSASISGSVGDSSIVDSINTAVCA